MPRIILKFLKAMTSPVMGQYLKRRQKAVGRISITYSGQYRRM